MKTLITDGPLFDGIKFYDGGSVLFENGKILSVFDRQVILEDTSQINAGGNLIMPGLVDLHSDTLERSIEKRKGVFFDVEFAILNLDRQLAACGITTFYHAISFADNELGLRSPQKAENCVRKINAFQSSGQALIRHFIHIRYEVGSEQSFKIILNLMEQGLVDMVSIMDHTPCQGQFRSMESYLKFHSDEYDLPSRVIIDRAREKQQNNNQAWQMVKALTERVTDLKIPLLSHDDDTVEKIDMIKSMGVGGCEFPVSIEAAIKAREEGLDLFMGSPNLVRNSSSNGNLKASDLLKEGICAGLVSDYYPESLLQAGFITETFTANPAKALQKVTSGPGSFLNSKNKPGFLEPGADADILIVNRDHKWAHLVAAFAHGHKIFEIQQPLPEYTAESLTMTPTRDQLKGLCDEDRPDQ
ncbi:MAG: alpha-D-ribose 1-methylphosphonate 5-triphosphate diphosphatase [Verrucomicrobiota bacterium]